MEGWVNEIKKGMDHLQKKQADIDKMQKTLQEKQDKITAAQTYLEAEQKKVLAEVENMRKERQAADASVSLALQLANQKTENMAKQTESILSGVKGLETEKKATAQLAIISEAGAEAIQIAIKAGANVTRQVALFSENYPRWEPDNGMEELNSIKYYPVTDMVYICINPIQRFAHYTPDQAENNYCPYPKADETGVYPYISGMLVWNGMKVRGTDGIQYICTMGEGTYKLVTEPAETSIFTEAGEEE